MSWQTCASGHTYYTDPVPCPERREDCCVAHFDPIVLVCPACTPDKPHVVNMDPPDSSLRFLVGSDRIRGTTDSNVILSEEAFDRLTRITQEIAHA